MARPKGLPKTGGRRRGVPNRATASVRSAAQAHTEEAIATLAEIMTSRDAAPAARVSAASALLDRGHGKPTQTLAGPGGRDLVPERTADPDRIAAALVRMIEAPTARTAAISRAPALRLIGGADNGNEDDAD
jgi:hypothetical protein